MATKNKTTAKLAKEIDALSKMAMSRGRVVVDEDLSEIVDALKNKNMRVDVPYKGEKDESIKRLIGNRIFITNNSKDFVGFAAETETWIIATENVKSSMVAADLADLVSKTIKELSLFSKGIRGGMLIKLNRKGKPTVQPISD